MFQRMLAVGLLLVTATPAFAGGAPTVEALIQEAERQNPRLLALRQKAEAAKARIPAAATLPDPRLSFEMMDLARPNLPEVKASQMIMFPGKLGKMGQMSAHMAEMALAEYENGRWMLASDIKGAYFDLYYLHRIEGINRESQVLLKDLIRMTNARYAVGQGMQADIVRPQVQLSKLLYDLLETQEKIKSAFARLNGLLGKPSNAAPWLPPSNLPQTPLRISRQGSILRIPQSPMLKMAQAEVARADAALALAKLGYFPDFEVGAGVAPGSGMGSGRAFSAMAGVTVPLWAQQKQANQVTEAEKALEAAKANLESRRQETATQVNSLFNQIERMDAQLKIVEGGMIPQAKLALKANLAAYQTGNGSYLMLLDAFMALYDHQMEAVMAVSEREKMVGMLEAQLGHSLEEGKRENEP